MLHTKLHLPLVLLLMDLLENMIELNIQDYFIMMNNMKFFLTKLDILLC